jgi:hypothetical protein
VLFKTLPERVDSRFSIALPELVEKVKGLLMSTENSFKRGQCIIGLGFVNPVTE